ncbi:type II toxin-antitoxin system VapC family toxin [Thalassobacter sp. 16PALIMAR09]|uniref:type II toxin-antitoxin system VapC family toxin n=1 Tax=Thalassobacter sp. 16PALIMAR09 TaxID=1225651 RepID=UPI00051DB0ED|nr:type II toxin-antitoxin system VapC family toxin [Thalassobacter sp. 16PALIMAR09]KGK99851.1 pilus assembly protein CpaF [Thalassobacter sp. 16PALIMAR09]
MYLLDTNVLSALRRPERAATVSNWLRTKPEEQLYISAITLGEIERGIVLQEDRNPGFAADLRRWIDRTSLLFSDRLLPFGTEDARIWGKLSAHIGNNGADLQIAATALAHGAIVVTGNVSDFEPTGVEIKNPF